MKKIWNAETFKRAIRLRDVRAAGTALVVVLASLAFLAALTLAFLSSVGMELKSSKRYADGVSSQILSQSAFNLAIAQIVEATKGFQGTNYDIPGPPVAWASQPGMIRTYNGSNPLFYYKLYSSSRMRVDTFPFDPATDYDTQWFNHPARYADLNEPLEVGDEKHYPIIDGNGLQSMTLPAPVGPVTTYNADGDIATPDIDGFYVRNAPLAGAVNAGANPVPMPVQWMYVLESGAIISPTGGTGDIATFTGGVDAPAADNKIVGRIAFWTDDETSKINPNTAAEGTYWDTPRMENGQEDAFGTRQPVNAEYQRYPGHPAMTCLSTVLKKPTGMTDAEWARRLFAISPRIQDGGSQAGTVNTVAGTTMTAIPLDADRLYATPDELMFTIQRRLNDPTSDGTNPDTAQVINAETLERAKFFLTASSRAPDLNLFNKPRVGIWPIHVTNTTAFRTAFDRLIAFCSTMRNDRGSNAYVYYFQRDSSFSPTNDLPVGPAVAGLGRNRMLLQYLQSLTSDAIPGFGGNFLAKYGQQDRNQILTEIFDYIRSTNLADPNISTTNRFAALHPDAASGGGAGNGGRGQVVPIEDPVTGTRGFGRLPTIMGCTLMFIATMDGDVPSSIPSPAPSDAPGPGQMQIQAIFIPQFFNPAIGSVFYLPYFTYQVTGLGSFAVNGNPMTFPAGASQDQVMKYYTDLIPGWDNISYGDQMGLRATANKKTGMTYVCNAINVPKTGSPPTFSFTGNSNLVIQIKEGTTILQTATIDFPGGTFPVPTLGPSAVTSTSVTGTWNYRRFSPSGRVSPNSSGWNQAAFFVENATQYDVVRSVSIKPGGDMRLVAARKTLPSPTSTDYPFAPVVPLTNPAAWSSSTARVRNMHNFFSGNTEAYFGARLGRLVSNLAYREYNAAGFGNNRVDQGQWIIDCHASPVAVNGVAAGKFSSFAAGDILGDWDNAPMNCMDGPFINKADEGDKGSNSGSYTWRGRDGIISITTALFTPNRMIPSAVTFGSLPTGVFANRPWQTLLFRPYAGHPGSRDYNGAGLFSTGMPADHLLLDLFHMPVVEPYAISEPLSTAGRINMNYQIVPFTYINRDTGIQALLKSEKVMAIPDTIANTYKIHWIGGQPSCRLSVNVNETLNGFRQRFAAHDIFRSASEICDLWVVPDDPASTSDTYANMATYWNSTNIANGHRLTGDNTRERIYATLYPRLTTKSNTFTVYARVQSLQQTPGDYGVWDESKDKITGEYRGFQTLERYIDPNDSRIPDYADPAVNVAISKFYKTRILATKQFAP